MEIFTLKFGSGASAIAQVKKSESAVTNLPDSAASAMVSIDLGNLFTVKEAVKLEEKDTVINSPYNDKKAMKTWKNSS